MSKEEARSRFIEYAIPIMERNNLPYDNPKKAIIDKQYNECIQEKLKAGQSLKEIEKARKAFLI